MKRLLFLSLFILSLCSVALAKVVKVAVLPFKVNAPGQKLTYVSQGLQDMLTTRLFVPGQVEVVPPEEVNNLCQGLKKPLTLTKAREIGKRLGVDYVVLGSLTSFGQSVSLDAELIPVKTNRAPIPLYTQAPTLDELIPKLTEMGQKAVAALQGHPLPRPKALAPAPIAKAPAPQMPKAQALVTPRQGALPPAQGAPSQQVTESAGSRKVAQVPPRPSPETHSEEALQGHPVPHSSEVSKGYKYSEIDPWPDYPPEDDDYGAAQPQVPAAHTKAEKQVEKKEKSGHSWSRLLPWNWFRKKKEEPALKKEPITPPPPPPPVSEAESSPPAQTARQQTAPPQNPPSQAPAKGTWQWY